MPKSAAQYKAIIADDEPLARRRSARLLRERDDVEIAAQCSGGLEAIAAIRQHKPHLALLDIQMPDVDGFGVVTEIGVAAMPQVVFVTAYDQHAIRAFEINAVDYVVKPYTPERFHEAVDRALSRIAAGSGEQARLGSTLEGMADRILIRDRDRIRLVRIRDVDWVASEANYVRLHVGTTSYLIRGNLGKLEEKLAPFGFIRVHRRFLVNVDRVAEVQPWFGGDAILVLSNNAKVRLSRTFREPFERRFLSP